MRSVDNRVITETVYDDRTLTFLLDFCRSVLATFGEPIQEAPAPDSQDDCCRGGNPDEPRPRGPRESC
jgi:hypothetical protein